MESTFTVLRDYTDRIEAETIRIRLAAAGIRALITGTDAATALGLGGAATWRMVRIEVPRADYDRATSLLLEDERRIAEAGPWICSRCREQNEAAFEVCWSCAKPRSQDDAIGRIDEPPQIRTDPDSDAAVGIDPPEGPMPEDGNPYRPVLLDGAQRNRVPQQEANNVAGEQTSAAVTRSFRAAIVGMILFPPIVSLYSIFLLISLNAEAYRNRELRNRVVIAWCINFVVVPISLFWWLMLIIN